MKKHSKLGAETRFQGTALGRHADRRSIGVDGAALTSVRKWCEQTANQAADLDGHERSRRPTERTISTNNEEDGHFSAGVPVQPKHTSEEFTHNIKQAMTDTRPQLLHGSSEILGTEPP